MRCLVVFLSCSCLVGFAPAPPLRPIEDPDQAISDFDRQACAADQGPEASLTSRKKQLLDRLEDLQDRLARRGRTDEAEAVHDRAVFAASLSPGHRLGDAKAMCKFARRRPKTSIVTSCTSCTPRATRGCTAATRTSGSGTAPPMPPRTTSSPATGSTSTPAGSSGVTAPPPPPQAPDPPSVRPGKQPIIASLLLAFFPSPESPFVPRQSPTRLSCRRRPFRRAVWVGREVGLPGERPVLYSRPDWEGVSWRRPGDSPR